MPPSDEAYTHTYEAFNLRYVTAILKHVDVAKDVCEARLVCKTWRRLVGDTLEERPEEFFMT